MTLNELRAIARPSPQFQRWGRGANRESRKGNTRRVLNRITGIGKITEFGPSPRPCFDWAFRDKRGRWNDVMDNWLVAHAPHGGPGTIWYQREPLNRVSTIVERLDGAPGRAAYADDGDNVGIENIPWKWKRDILTFQYMPKAAARTFFRVTGVRVQRVKDISDEDIAAEGVSPYLAATLLKPADLPNGQWVAGGSEGLSYCPMCINKAVREEKALAKAAGEDPDRIQIDGGYEAEESDYAVTCEECAAPLAYWLIDPYGVDHECGVYEADFPDRIDPRAAYELEAIFREDRTGELGRRVMRLAWNTVWTLINGKTPGCALSANPYVFVYDYRIEEYPA